jgi:DNA-binding transcriptional LysR family regulator
MRVFESVIEKGSFAAAARSMDLSPAVVTRLVADLEEHLGTRLLQRSTRRMSLTDAGEAYIDRLRQILHDIDDADAEVSTHSDQLAGELHISAPPVVATHLLAPMIAGFRQRYPNIVFDVHVDPIDSPSIEDYDLTLLAVGEGFNGSIIARKIATTSAILVASPQYIKQRGSPLQPMDLSTHACLRLRLPGLRSTTWQLMRSEQDIEDVLVPVTPVLWANHTDTLLRAALDGAGITSIAQDLVAPHIANGELVRVLRPWISGRISVYAAFPSRKFMPRRTRIFLDYLTEQAQKIVEVAKECC